MKRKNWEEAEKSFFGLQENKFIHIDSTGVGSSLENTLRYTIQFEHMQYPYKGLSLKAQHQRRMFLQVWSIWPGMKIDFVNQNVCPRAKFGLNQFEKYLSELISIQQHKTNAVEFLVFLR